MMSIVVVFWMYVILFAIIGGIVALCESVAQCIGA